VVGGIFPDSRTLLTGGTDRTIRRWPRNTPQGERLDKSHKHFTLARHLTGR